MEVNIEVSEFPQRVERDQSVPVETRTRKERESRRHTETAVQNTERVHKRIQEAPSDCELCGCNSERINPKCQSEST
jgi:predicted Zn-ribbon and HTH transcriptional regulator